MHARALCCHCNKRLGDVRLQTRKGGRQGPPSANFRNKSGGMEFYQVKDASQVACFFDTTVCMLLQDGNEPRRPLVVCQGSAGFATAQSPVVVNRSRYVFEVEADSLALCGVRSSLFVAVQVVLETGGLAQFGWSTKDHQPDASKYARAHIACCSIARSTRALRGRGCGDDAHSWGYDGFRGLKWHNGRSELYGGKEAWRPGDIIGCAVDLDKKEVCNVARLLGT